jgi:hypothetical protein
MDMDNPLLLFSGILIGAIGMGLFIYGKKNSDLGALLMGVVLSVLPLMSHTMLVMWGITGLSSAGMYLLRRIG